MPDYHRQLDSGEPLGGIGAGKIEFCKDGRFTNVTTNNNWDCPIIDSDARIPPIPRILEGDKGSVEENIYRRRMMFSAEGIPGAWTAVHTPICGARVLKSDSRKAFTITPLSDIRYGGRFPVARVQYSGLSSVQVKLDAFGSFVSPDDSDGYRDSSLPLALFVFDRMAPTRNRLRPMPSSTTPPRPSPPDNLTPDGKPYNVTTPHAKRTIIPGMGRFKCQEKGTCTPNGAAGI